MGILGRLFGGDNSKADPSRPILLDDPNQGFANVPDLAASFLLREIVGDREDRLFGGVARVEQLIIGYPNRLRAAVQLWCMYYLAWAYRSAFARKYGSEAAEDLVKAVYAQMSRVDSLEMNTLRDRIIFWMNRLSEAAEQSMSKTDNSKQVQLPVSFLAALNFLTLDPDSPSYNMEDFDQQLCDQLMITLSILHDEFLDRVSEFAQYAPSAKPLVP